MFIPYIVDILSGNDVIHEITSHNRHELRIDMYDFDGQTKYAKYSMFMIGDEKSEYELTVLGYKGNAGICIIKKLQRISH